MSEFEQSTTVQAAPDAVWEFVSDVRNLPKYLPTTHSAEPQKGERVRVKGEAQGHAYDADGYFRTDQSARRMEWGSDGEMKYSGWLQVAEAGQNASQVTVHIAMSPPQEMIDAMKEQGGHDHVVNDGIKKSLQSIANIMEGKGGKVEPEAATDETENGPRGKNADQSASDISSTSGSDAGRGT